MCACPAETAAAFASSVISATTACLTGNEFPLSPDHLANDLAANADQVHRQHYTPQLLSVPAPMAPADPLRLRLYGYLAAQEVDDYVAIMSWFTNSLLAEWSSQDLVDRGLDLPVETVEARCRYLADHGNLLISPREVRVTSIAEYQRQPARYAVSALGARLHREVQAFLAATGGAREVPRELLGLVADGLVALSEGPGSSPDTAEAEVVAGMVSTIFGQFYEFSASVTDFYTYIGSVLTRSDLDGDEWMGFKSLLLDYLESIVDSVRRHSPVIEATLTELEPALPALLDRLSSGDAAFTRLEEANPGSESVERARGRTRRDWDQLADWFASDRAHGSGASELRAAAGLAVGSLLGNLKRIIASSTRETSLRRHFLKLAGWFDSATPQDAHVLFTSAFGLYGARHLGVPLDDNVAEAVPAIASWWQSPVASVPVSIRERGDRNPRGHTVRAADYEEQKQRLLSARRAEAERRATGCAELVAVGEHLAEAHLSSAASSVLLELLGTAVSTMDSGMTTSSAALVDHPARLWVRPGDSDLTLHGEDGDLIVHRLDVVVTSGTRPVWGRDDAERDQRKDTA